MGDFAHDSSSTVAFKDWLLGWSGNPVLVDISPLGCCDWAHQFKKDEELLE